MGKAEEKGRNASLNLQRRVVTSSRVVRAVVEKVPSTYEHMTSLLVQGGQSLLSWRLKEGSDIKAIEFDRSFRYVCLIEDTFKVAFARVVQSRITFVSNHVVFEEEKIGGYNCKIQVIADWSGTDPESNMKCVIESTPNVQPLHVKCWFGLANLDLLDSYFEEPIDGRKKLDEMSQDRVRAWFNVHRDEFHHLIMKKLLTPFKFERNTTGRQVTGSGFFGPIGSVYQLRASKIDDYIFLCARQIEVAGTIATSSG